MKIRDSVTFLENDLHNGTKVFSLQLKVQFDKHVNLVMSSLSEDVLEYEIKRELMNWLVKELYGDLDILFQKMSYHCQEALLLVPTYKYDSIERINTKIKEIEREAQDFFSKVE